MIIIITFSSCIVLSKAFFIRFMWEKLNKTQCSCHNLDIWTFNKHLDEQNYGPAKVKKTYICTFFSVHYAGSETSTHLWSLNDF